ncbi:MAG: Uracil-DNA glycosylase family 4 [Rhodospirillaceae bacterium]|nr:MAG: Uracil-DNA glycosylase family 4 [Rhodospirillaceae bacterium]
MNRPLSSLVCLRWHLEAGVDEAVGETPVDYYAVSARPPSVQTAQTAQTALGAPSVPSVRITPLPATQAPLGRVLPPAAPFAGAGLADAAVRTAAELAARCATLEDLRAAIAGFDGCPVLKASATQTVFADGVPTAPVMVIGEAPGGEEDRQGLPFVGPSGRLLDRMLESIGLDRRSNCYITNVVPWRPPVNRKPMPAEVGVLLPFLERHIVLAAPRILLLVGGLAASTVLAHNEGIMKLRGRWFEYSSGLPRPIPVIATFHPAYLLRSPAQKRFAWRDLLTLKQRLQALFGEQG